MIFLWVCFCVIIIFALKTQDIFSDGKHCRLPVVWLLMERKYFLLSMSSFWLFHFPIKGKEYLLSCYLPTEWEHSPTLQPKGWFSSLRYLVIDAKIIFLVINAIKSAVFCIFAQFSQKK